ncbi:Uncharacterised protein [Actinomyces viscosus]|uniref:Uncharacterized protein n=1 Tax=Actinomyces viscosus TaxID=1656 RepID=A0A3S4VZ61_ACTVI|nr:Uncharacterised protein [Actinomyces viscosus]
MAGHVLMCGSETTAVLAAVEAHPRQHRRPRISAPPPAPPLPSSPSLWPWPATPTSAPTAPTGWASSTSSRTHLRGRGLPSGPQSSCPKVRPQGRRLSRRCHQSQTREAARRGELSGSRRKWSLSQRITACRWGVLRKPAIGETSRSRQPSSSSAHMRSRMALVSPDSSHDLHRSRLDRCSVPRVEDSLRAIPSAICERHSVADQLIEASTRRWSMRLRRRERLVAAALSASMEVMSGLRVRGCCGTRRRALPVRGLRGDAVVCCQPCPSAYCTRSGSYWPGVGRTARESGPRGVHPRPSQ